MDQAEAAGWSWKRAPKAPQRAASAGPGRRLRTAVRVLALALSAVLIQVPGVLVAAPAGASDTKIDASLLALPDDKVVDFWVTFVNKAQLSTAARTPGWRNRGQAVVDGLQQTARNSQAGVVGLLTARGIKFDSYWIANTVKVNGPKSLMRQLAARRDVERVVPDQTFDLPEPTPAAELDAGTVEWNIDAVNAPDVWDGLTVTGQGIVVANLDTGVQFDHPALVNQYRGNLGGGAPPRRRRRPHVVGRPEPGLRRGPHERDPGRDRGRRPT